MTLVLPALVAPALVAGSSPARAAATCLGQEATITASDRQRVTGTDAADVIVVHNVGRVDARGGDDLVCTTSSGSHGFTEIRADGGDDRVEVGGRQARDVSLATRLGSGDDVYMGSASSASQDVEAGDPSGVGLDRITTGGGFDAVQSGRPGSVNRDVVALGGDGDQLELGGRLAGSFTGGGGRDALVVSGGTHGAWSLDLTAGTLDAGRDRAGVASFAIVELVGARFTDLRVRGTSGHDDVRVSRAGRAVPGRVEARLGAGNDYLSLTFRRDLTGRVRLGTGSDFLEIDTGVAFDSPTGPVGAISGSLVTDAFEVLGRPWTVSGVEDLWAAQFRAAAIRGDAGPNLLQVQACRTDARGGKGGDALIVVGAYGCPRDPVTVLRGQAGDDELHGSEWSREVLIGGPGRDRADGGAGRRDRCTAEVIERC